MVYRIRLIEPISADFAVLVGDAIRNLRSSLNQVAYQLAAQHSGPLTEDAERMTKLPIRISGRAVRRLGDFEEQTDEAAPLGDLREARFRTIRSGQPFAFAERLTRSADDRGSAPLGRSQEAERDNDVRFVLNRLRNVYKHRRLPLLAATLAREGGR